MIFKMLSGSGVVVGQISPANACRCFFLDQDDGIAIRAVTVTNSGPSTGGALPMACDAAYRRSTS